jgi:hypothetical protein
MGGFRTAKSNGRNGRTRALRTTAGDDADDQREKRGAFDQRRRDDHGRLDVAGDFRLAGHALDSVGTDAANAHCSPDDDQASAESCAEVDEGAFIAGTSASSCACRCRWSSRVAFLGKNRGCHGQCDHKAKSQNPNEFTHVCVLREKVLLAAAQHQ